MKTDEYWAQRAVQREQESFDSTTGILGRLRNIYNDAAARLSQMAQKIFTAFTTSTGKKNMIDPQEARKLLSESQTAEVLQELRKKFVKTGDMEALKKLNAPAYGYRLNRVQAMRQAVEAQMQLVGDMEAQLGTQQLAKTYDAAYYKTMYDRAVEPGGIPAVPAGEPGTSAAIEEPQFSKLSTRAIQEAVENKWHGANYSERVWANTEKVAQEAGRIIDAGVTAGTSVANMSTEIRNLFGVAYYAAERLVRTEVSRMHNNATLKGYKATGVKWYTWLGTLDARTCELCGELDGQHFKLSDAVTGKTLPPRHPNCRCTTTAYYPDENRKGKRIARDPETGRNYYIDRGKTYEDWRKEIAKKYGDNALEKAQKRIRNRAYDALQMKTMHQALPEDVPLKLAKFQDVKYNDPEKWEDLRYYFRNLNGRPVAYVKIDRELEKAGILKRGRAYPVELIEITGWRGHAEKRLQERGLTKEQAADFMKDAVVMFKRYPEPNTVNDYYTHDGLIGVRVKDGVVQTTYGKGDFGKETEKILEVVDKYVPHNK